ncbi:hypothetical protein D3C73_643730 [compost metagenome]
MLTPYQLTPLEQWIETLYKELNIVTPDQLHIHELAAKFNIWVYYMDMKSMVVERQGLFSVNIDRRLSSKEQWEEFLHELCHVLRHSGNQTSMPMPFLDWQEQDAANFQLYAAIPFSMVSRLHLPERQIHATQLLVEEFHVTHKLAATRLEQIQRRVWQGILDQEYRAQLEKQTSKYNPANWSDETRYIMDRLQQQIDRKGASSNG